MGLFNSYLGAWSKIASGVGTGLNSLTGATQASKLQEKYNLINGAVNQGYALQSAKVNNLYQKEFAQNAHQWEVEDLKKAGLNPVLSAGGSGASASGGGVSAGSNSGAGIAQSGINPLDVILNGVTTMTTAKRTKAETANLDTDAALKAMQTLYVGKQAATETATKNKIDAEIKQIATEIGLKTKQQEIGHAGEWLGTGIIGSGKQIIDIIANRAGDKLSSGQRKAEKIGQIAAKAMQKLKGK